MSIKLSIFNILLAVPVTNEHKENSLFEKPHLGEQDYSSEEAADRSSDEQDKDIRGWAKDDFGKHAKDFIQKDDTMNRDEESYSSEDYNDYDSEDYSDEDSSEKVKKQLLFEII